MRLADGQDWWLPDPGPVHGDATLEDLLAAVSEAEDLAEARQAGLALTIHLLCCNYELAPSELRHLLSFGADRTALSLLQETVDRLAFDALARRRPTPPDPAQVPRPGLTCRLALGRWMRARWPWPLGSS